MIASQGTQKKIDAFKASAKLPVLGMEERSVLPLRGMWHRVLRPLQVPGKPYGRETHPRSRTAFFLVWVVTDARGYNQRTSYRVTFRGAESERTRGNGFKLKDERFRLC